MIGSPLSDDHLTLYGSFTSSSSYKPMLYLALAGLPFSFRTVNLKIGVQNAPEYLAINRWGVVPSLRHRGLVILQSNVILDYLARTTGHFEGEGEQERWQAREWLSWEADHITAVARVRHSARFRKMHDEVIADKERLVFDRLIDKRQGSLGARTIFCDGLRVSGAEARRVAHLGDIGDVVGLPRQPLARLPTLLLGPGFEMPGLARQVVEDHIRLQDGQAAMA